MGFPTGQHSSPQILANFAVFMRAESSALFWMMSSTTQSGGGEGVDDRKRSNARHNPGMGETAAHAKENNIAFQWRPYLARARQKEAEIALLVTMQEPVFGVGARIEFLDEAEIAIDADQEHRAVDAVAFDVCRVMVRRPEPCAGLSDNGYALQRCVVTQ